ncbi:MAG: putative spermidine/putrescine transport system substrate-binding protein [Thermomicrobiales bacterium]|jgi:putative spermidine/putrescine transport system substrate-binding protein|nr:putative spermidine/putrescine transport system substrate-binding protein [Thermomicrobiales bacterium]MEA2526836.1 putative spermidine/putrescine transport system substrate-binding protein [Thermomicrobiales bacterium]
MANRPTSPIEQALLAERSRRALLKGVGGAGLSLAGLTAFGGGPTAAQSEIDTTMFVWVGSNQGVVPREVREQYLKEHPGTTIELLEGTNAETYPKIKASLQMTPDDPLVNFGFFNIDATTKGTLDDVWLPLDKTKVPNLDNILDPYRRPNDIGVFWGLSGIGLVYHKEEVNPPPTSWADLWDPKYKGRVAFWDAPAWSFNGLVAAARLNGGSEDNIEPGLKLYADAAKSGHIHSLYNANDQLRQLMVSGEVVISVFFKGIMAPWEQEGAPIGYVVPKEGQIAFPLGLQMVRGSDQGQQDVAQDMINRLLDKETLRRYCNLTAAIPAGKDIKLDPPWDTDPAYQEEAIANAMQLDWAKIAEHNDEWTEMWNRDVVANLA